MKPNFIGTNKYAVPFTELPNLILTNRKDQKGREGEGGREKEQQERFVSVSFRFVPAGRGKKKECWFVTVLN